MEGKEMYSFLKVGSVKIHYALALRSQGNELTGKGNKTKQLRKNLSMCPWAKHSLECRWDLRGDLSVGHTLDLNERTS